MKLMTKELRRKLPAIYETQLQETDAMCVVKFFTPDANWTWYVIEGSPALDDDGNEIDFTFFGLVDGIEMEMGYFSLKELQSVRGNLGLPIERDLYWQPKPLKTIYPG